MSLALVSGCSLPFSVPPQRAKIYRIARLVRVQPSSETAATGSAFRQSLRDLGYVEGQNLILDVRLAITDDELSETVTELVGLDPEVILVPSASDARIVQAATSTIPIVSEGPGDLVARGLGTTLARPGNNVTGLSSPSLAGKQLQLLREAVPALSRVAVLFDLATSSIRSENARQPYEAAARTLGLQLQFVGASGPDDLEPVFDTVVRQHGDGLYVTGGGLMNSSQGRIVELAVRSRLPSIWIQIGAVAGGGLMAYGPNQAGLYRRAATYVDKILKGANPADLPIEQPTVFDFIINLKTAQALGLTIPPTVLAQATEVIQ